MSSQRPGSPPASQGSTQPLTKSHTQQSSQSSQTRQQIRPIFASDEQPGLEVVRPPTRGGGRDRPAETAKSFWSEHANRNPSEYTFYREPTPTPDDYPEREKNDGPFPPVTAVTRRPGRSSTIALETALAIEPPPRKPRQDVVCGLRKWVFICILAAVVFLVVGIALGVGIGVGLGSHDREVKDPGGGSSSSAPSPITSNPSTTSQTMASSGPTHSSTSSSAKTIPTASPTTDCPFVNNTIYQVPGSSIKFLRLCGIDYSGNTESVDLSHIPTNSFAGCMDNCAGTSGCTGCSWGVAEGETGSEHQCWMKSNLKTGHKSVPEWCFGVLQ